MLYGVRAQHISDDFGHAQQRAVFNPLGCAQQHRARPQQRSGDAQRGPQMLRGHHQQHKLRRAHRFCKRGRDGKARRQSEAGQVAPILALRQHRLCMRRRVRP
jgi:hypothetical protein